MSHSLVIQCTYETIQIALFQNNEQRAAHTEDKKTASKNLVLAINELLTQASILLDDLDFIAASEGPAPFTTMRTLIATINGISFAHPVPLVGLNSMHIMLDEYKTARTTVCIFNAFHRDVYAAIAQPGQNGYTDRCENITVLLSYLKNAIPEPITLIGQGVTTFRDDIHEILGAQALISEIVPEYPTLEELNRHARTLFEQGVIKKQLAPLYLKTVAYKKVLDN